MTVNKIIITVLGQDRPGILAAVSGVLYRLDCNIENVSQTILQSEFAGIFIASRPEELSRQSLMYHLEEELLPRDLYIHMTEVKEGRDEVVLPESDPFVITTMGPDRKGIVAAFTGILARYGVNVTQLRAVFKGGDDPHNNTMIYQVDVPRTSDQKELRRELREQAKAFQLEISIQHRDIFEAIHRV